MRWVTSRLRGALLLAGLVLLAVLVARVGPAEILGQVTGVGPAIVWLLIAYAAGTTAAALPWYLLLPAEARPPVRSAVASRFAAAGANAVLPLFGVGGEPTRLLWLRSQDRAPGVAAIIADRLLYVVASGVFLLAGVLALLETASMPDRYVAAGAVAAALLVVIGAVGCWVVARHRLAERIHRLGRRMSGKVALDGGNGFGAEVDRALDPIIAGPPSRLVASLLIHLLARVLLGAEIYAGFLILDIPISPAEALVFASVPVLLSFVGSVVPSQIGLQEGTQALVAVALGVPPAGAVAVVLLQRVRQVATVGLAWVLIALARR